MLEQSFADPPSESLRDAQPQLHILTFLQGSTIPLPRLHDAKSPQQ